jgi:hypothetical protein
MNRQLDIAFIKRVYRTTTWVWMLSLLLCWAYRNLPMAIGITVGFGISIGSLMLLERLVTTLFSPEQSDRPKRAVKWLLVIAFFKYAMIGVILWASLRSVLVSPAGIAIGIGLPYAVIGLKALGMVLTFGPETDRRS